MASSWWIARFRNRLIRAAEIATPADGPSFGTAPAGTWMWRSVLVILAASSPIALAWLRRKLRAAWALSRIDSPRRPVRVSVPLPGIPVTSMKRISPPVGVQARPVATPGVPVRSATSRKYRGGPSISERASGSIVTRALFPSACFRATFRQTVATSRSRFRRPASRV